MTSSVYRTLCAVWGIASDEGILSMAVLHHQLLLGVTNMHLMAVNVSSGAVIQKFSHHKGFVFGIAVQNRL